MLAGRPPAELAWASGAEAEAALARNGLDPASAHEIRIALEPIHLGETGEFLLEGRTPADLRAYVLWAARCLGRNVAWLSPIRPETLRFMILEVGSAKAAEPTRLASSTAEATPPPPTSKPMARERTPNKPAQPRSVKRTRSCKDCGTLLPYKQSVKSLGRCKNCLDTLEARRLVTRYGHEIAAFRAREVGEFRPFGQTAELSWQALGQALRHSGRTYTLIQQDHKITRVLFHATRGMEQISVVQGGAIDSNRRRH